MKKFLALLLAGACATGVFAARAPVQVDTVTFQLAFPTYTQLRDANQFVLQNGTYANPGWLTTLHWSKLIGVPAGFADGIDNDSGGGGGSGTVTSVSSGNLSPLFTVGITNPTTTPAFAFTLSTAAQNAVLAGPSSGGAGAPSYRALALADMPGSLGTWGGITPSANVQSLAAAADYAAIKALLSLDNVNNTSDAAKPISTATQTALDLKLSAAAIDTVAERTALGIKSTTAGSPEVVVDHPTMGSAETFDLAAGNVHKGILDAASCAITLTGFTNGVHCSGSALLTQDATGGRLATWPGVVTAPTLNPAANSITRVDYWSIDGGTTIFAQSDYAAGGLADDSVTYAKIQNISATSRVLGRITAGAGDTEELTGANVRTIAGLATSDSPELTGVNVGHASDTTITRTGAGDIAVEGNAIFRVGGSFTGLPGHEIIAISDETTAITTGTAKVTWRAPFALTITAVRASLATASSSGLSTFDINEAGTTILSTKLTIDASEKTSTTAATAAVISDSAIADDAEITIDVDTAGTGATGAKITIYYVRA